MKRGLFRVLILLLIVAAIASASILYVGIKHGSGIRALLTMRSGLIKMRRGFYEFGRGLRDFTFRGLTKYSKKAEKIVPVELDEFEYERIERENLEALEAEKEAAAQIEAEQAEEQAAAAEIMHEKLSNSINDEKGVTS